VSESADKKDTETEIDDITDTNNANSVETDDDKSTAKEAEDSKPKKRTFRDIERIPGAEFLRSQSKKILGALFVVILMLIIIELSQIINRNAESSLGTNATVEEQNNPDNVLSTSDNLHLALMALSGIVYILILGFFTKLVFFDEREAFGIESLRSIRSILFFLITIVFITLIFILFDIALVKIYLFTLPTYLIWNIHNSSFSIPFLSDVIIGQTDRKSYSDVRGFLFSILLSFMIAFPLALVISLIARFARRKVRKKTRTWQPYKLKNWIFFISAYPGMLVLLILFARLSEQDVGFDAEVILIPLMIGLFAWWVMQFIILSTRAIRLNSSAISANISIVFLIVFIFYFLPGILWATWDVVIIITRDTIENTIYSIDSSANAEIDPLTANTRSSVGLLNLYFDTIKLNLSNILRILELDFVIIVGLSSLAIGFAEGYSLIAIVKGLYRGVSIAKSGRYATKSAPRGFVVASNTVLLGAWFSLFWDKVLLLWNGIILTFSIDLPLIDVPSLFEIVFDFTLELNLLGGLFIAISILLIPTYFVVTSSFKFLSVSLVAERLKEDNLTFFFLISSAFILIATNILAQITELPAFSAEGGNDLYLPLRGVATEELLPFVKNIFGALEAFGFVVGLGFTLVLGLKNLLVYITKKILRQA